MKKLLLIIFGALFVHGCLSALPKEVKFQFEPGTIAGIAGVRSIEDNVSAFLSAINSAYISDQPLSFDGIKIEHGVSRNLQSLWKNTPFYCEDDMIISKCLFGGQGLHVRDIPITLKPFAATEGSAERELSISLTKEGIITGARFALDDNEVMKEDGTLSEVRERLEILRFIEDLRVYFMAKDIDALRKFYSVDDIIVKNGVIQVRKMDKEFKSMANTSIGNAELLQRLMKMFHRNENIEVGFERISIVRQGAHPQFYGVSLLQTIKSNGDLVKGWLFMLWDFTNPDEPVIHIRTWQPEDDVKEEGGIFNLNDFYLDNISRPDTLAAGQTLMVEKFVLAPMDQAARVHRRNDLNDQPCALIRVQLAKDGAVFRGNVFGDVTYRDGEYLVYMMGGSKFLQVMIEGCLPLMIDFNKDWKISGVEPMNTYILSLVLK